MAGWLFIILLLPGLVFAGEYCSSAGGVCRDSCSGNEVAEQGGFLDCTDSQECCVSDRKRENPEVGCCVFSFGPGSAGKDNCCAPKNGLCVKGTPSPLDCSRLIYCNSSRQAEK